MSRTVAPGLILAFALGMSCTDPDSGNPSDAGHHAPPPDAGDESGADAGAPPVADGGGLDAGAPGNVDAGTSPDADAGTPPDADAGTPADADGGTPSTADGGAPADAGTDPLAGLPPMRADCVGGAGGASACWGEWLKEMGTVDFAPVARGALGAGPWPTTPVVWLGTSTGLDRKIIAASTDTAQNLYAVSRAALFILRPGAATFERYDRATSGLRDYPFLSVAGAGPGIAWVGYEGLFGADAEIDPPEIRHSGDVQRLTLSPGGGFVVKDYDTHNSNTPITGKYDHSRSIFRIVVPRRGPAAGEVYLGTEHGVVRYQGDLYADHLHTLATVGTSERGGAYESLAVNDDGTLWCANDFLAAGKAFVPRRYEWYFTNPWIHPTFVYGAEDDRDLFRGAGFDSKGNVWLGSYTLGVANLVFSGRRMEIVRETPPDLTIHDLVVDLDDSVWVGTDSGAWRRDPATGEWKPVPGLDRRILGLYLDDTVAPRAIYLSSDNGLGIYRGP